ncbi:MAG: hypothetical protein EPO07_04200 [Verrucomicrobia bacterium]|nr:MAG: hypothetical protein EPO07_04200 [Verrucomicrobiota bacterium]
MNRALVISLIANGLLVLAAVQVFRAPARAVRASMQTDEPVNVAATVRVTNVIPGETSFVTNRFQWRQLESTNCDALVAKLRAVGCPERTIRDIVVGDAWREWNAFQHPEYDHQLFWLSGPRLVATQRKREAEEMKLKTEIAVTLRRLFGCEWSPELPRDPIKEDLVLGRLVIGDVTEEKFERVLGVVATASEAKEAMRQRLRLEEDCAALRSQRDESERKIRAQLSPAEFEEFRARVGLVELINHGEDLLELGISGARLREIALATTEVRPLGWGFLDLDDSESAEAKEAAEQAVKEVVRQHLGDDGFAQLEDSNYRSICKFAREHSLATETARKMNDVRKAASEEARRLREDKTLEKATREERLREVSASVSQAVNELLGKNLYAEFLQQNNNWVTNHASL